MRPLKSFSDNRHGGIAIMSAAGLTLLCIMAAVVIDGASIALAARRAQSAADLGALAAARDLSSAHRAARATAVANVGSDLKVTTTTGLYVPDASVVPSQRFAATNTNANAA